MTLPTSRIIVFLALVCFLITGQLQYFGGINSVLWVPYMLAFALFPFALRIGLYATGGGVIAKLVLAFVLGALISTALNHSPLIQAIAGGKSFICFWVFFFTVAYSSIGLSTFHRLLRWSILIAILQVPFVLYQFFYIAPSATWDAVVGTFGGDPAGGGASGSMAFFLVGVLVLCVSLWQAGQLSSWRVVVIASAVLTSIALAEVKIALVLLPLGIGLLTAPDLFHRPLRFIVLLALSLGGALAILTVYNDVFYAAAGYAASDSESLLKIAQSTIAMDQISSLSGEMDRVAAFAFWYTEGFSADTIRGVFGYGMGASRSASTFAVGEVAKHYYFGIDRSVGTTILWDTGVLGLALYLAIVVYGSLDAFRLAKRVRKSGCSNVRSAYPYLLAAGSILGMTTLMVPYGRDLLEVPAAWMFLTVWLAYVVRVRRYIQDSA